MALRCSSATCLCDPFSQSGCMEQGTWQGDALFCCRHLLLAMGRWEAPQDRELTMSHTSPLTTLDVIVMITLYSHQYRSLVESIIDLMTPRKTISFLRLLPPLI